MNNYIEVAKVGELTEGTMKMVMAKRREILLVRVGCQHIASSWLPEGI